MKPFNQLTFKDVQWLRRQPDCIPYGKQGVIYNFSAQDIYNARQHLQTLYPNCRVQERFASRILLLNEIY